MEKTKKLIIIGYSNMFRLCGLFSTRSKEYRFLNTLYHFLSNYPLRGAPANKNKFILLFLDNIYNS